MDFHDFGSKFNLQQNGRQLNASFMLMAMVQIPASYLIPSTRYLAYQSVIVACLASFPSLLHHWSVLIACSIFCTCTVGDQNTGGVEAWEQGYACPPERPTPSTTSSSVHGCLCMTTGLEYGVERWKENGCGILCSYSRRFHSPIIVVQYAIPVFILQDAISSTAVSAQGLQALVLFVIAILADARPIYGTCSDYPNGMIVNRKHFKLLPGMVQMYQFGAGLD